MRHRLILWALSMMVAAPCVWSADTFVWIEGEAAQETNFPKGHGVPPKTAGERDVLSGGAWLTAYTKKEEPLFARWAFSVPHDGEYTFWVRKCWYHGPFKYQFDDQEGRELSGRSYRLMDSVTLRKHIPANWVKVGKVPLKKGAHTLRIETIDKGPWALDCFLLTLRPFKPNGKMKPGAKYNRTEPGWFAFEPDIDAFDTKALLDLRHLNHKQCGEQGYLRTRGKDFVWEKTPEQAVKFWGMCVGTGTVRQEKATVDHFARLMAKLGVNMVRIHGRFHDPQDSSLKITAEYLDQFNYFVAALRKNGIYLMLNTYYYHFFDAGKAGIPGYKKGAAVHYQFIHPDGQALCKRWCKRLLTAKNPYTGLVNAVDPTIAIIQLSNEDNYFFWTFTPYGKIPAEVIVYLEKRFADWLVKKYGSLDKAQAAWGQGFPAVKGDAFAEGRVGLFSVWHLTDGAREKRGNTPQRFYDQAEFLTQDLRSVQGMFQDYLKQDLGYKGLVNGGNWLCADQRVLEPLDKYANMVNDVMDRHGVGFYAPAKMVQGWGLNKGDIYQDTAPIRDPEDLSIMDIQYEGKPHIYSEPKCAMPNRFRTTWMPLMACYGLLQGTDAIAHFAAGNDWAKMNGRWPVNTPVGLGQSPATALIYRKRYIQEGPAVFHESLALKDLYQLKGGALVTKNIDETLNTAEIADAGVAKSFAKYGRLAFFTGSIVRDVSDKPGPSKSMNLDAYIDRTNKVVKSVTGELAWHWDPGVLRITAPCAQGVTGFLRQAGRQDLGDVAIETQSEYGAILIVSLDGRPLKRAGRILVQVMSEDKNYGRKVAPVKTALKKKGPVVDALRVLEVGGPPILVKDLEGTVTIKRPDAAVLKVTALDFNGYKKQSLPSGQGDAVAIKLLPDVLYYIVQK